MALNRVPVSVLIPCYNSADVIGDCLESVSWADEIFVCDSFSTDATLEIARRYTDRIVQHAHFVVFFQGVGQAAHHARRLRGDLQGLAQARLGAPTRGGEGLQAAPDPDDPALRVHLAHICLRLRQ